MVTKAIPQTSEEFAEVLADQARVNELMADPEAWSKFVAAYAAKSAQHDPDLQKQAAEQQAKVLKEQMAGDGGVKRLPVSPEAQLGRMPTFAENREKRLQLRSQGAAMDGEWDTFGDYLSATHHRYIQTNGLDKRLAKALGEGQGDQGGFLVPEEFRAEIMRLSLETAVVRPRATVVPMTRETIAIPAIRDASHASTIFGGVRAYWTPEAGTITTSEPTFSQVRLNAHKLAGGTVVSNELMEDSALSLEALLMGMFGDAVGFFEDDSFINGTGAGQPLGVLNADAIVTVAKETGQAAATIVWENVIKMFSRMLPQSIARGVWVANNDCIPQLAVMSLSVGTGGSAIWLQNGQGALPTSILGRPIVYTEKAQTLGTAGDLYFVDFSQYLIGDRRSMRVDSSIHSQFSTDQTEWKFTHRVDGRPWLDTALTPRNGTNTLTPFVNLATRA